MKKLSLLLLTFVVTFNCLVATTASAQKIAAGLYFSLSVCLDSTVKSWGYNYYGQLGEGDTINKITPVDVYNQSQVIAVSAGEYHSLALRKDSTIWSWGNNTNGQLGNGSLIHRTLPVQVLGVTHVTAIAAGQNHSLALKKDSTVWDWGYNVYGQLGDSTTNLVDCECKEQAVKVHTITHVTAISAGSYHSLALRSDSTVWAWGGNADGQLGDSTNLDRISPVKVYGLTKVIAIAAGGSHNLALRSDSTVWAWGLNANGQLGDSTIITKIIPVKINALSGITAIAASTGHSLSLKSDSTVMAWGSNSYDQLGDGTLLDAHYPILVPYVRHTISIAAGNVHSIALQNNYSMLAWGNDYYGIGDGSTNTIGCQCLYNAEPVAAFCSGVKVKELTMDNNQWSIAPNPFTYSTTLSFNTEQKQTVIKIMDVLGKQNRTLYFSGKQLVIEKGNLENGIYFIQITNTNGNTTYRKMVVQ